MLMINIISRLSQKTKKRKTKTKEKVSKKTNYQMKRAKNLGGIVGQTVS